MVVSEGVANLNQRVRVAPAATLTPVSVPANTEPVAVVVATTMLEPGTVTEPQDMEIGNVLVYLKLEFRFVVHEKK